MHVDIPFCLAKAHARPTAAAPWVRFRYTDLSRRRQLSSLSERPADGGQTTGEIKHERLRRRRARAAGYRAGCPACRRRHCRPSPTPLPRYVRWRPAFKNTHPARCRGIIASRTRRRRRHYYYYDYVYRRRTRFFIPPPPPGRINHATVWGGGWWRANAGGKNELRVLIITCRKHVPGVPAARFESEFRTLVFNGNPPFPETAWEKLPLHAIESFGGAVYSRTWAPKLKKIKPY